MNTRAGSDVVRRRWVTGLGLVVVAGCAVSYVLTDDPGISHTSALNTLFDSRLVVALTRTLLLTVVVYLFASICVRAARGQWIRSAGPIEVGPTQHLVDDQEDLQHQLTDANRTIKDLQGRLARSLSNSEQVVDTLTEPHDVVGASSPDEGEFPHDEHP